MAIPPEGRRTGREVAVGVCVFLAAVAAGCHAPSSLTTAARYRHGLVLILPGIEGRSLWNRNIAVGLDKGGVRSAIEIQDWTTGVPGNFVANLTDFDRNLQQARMLAGRIVEYESAHPDRPVHLIGHSGGGGMVVLTLEALPPGRVVDGAILLAAAISPDHDLTVALRRTRWGICNFYSPRDVTLLKVGTSLLGPIDRAYGPAAGAVGFREPAGLDVGGRKLYEHRLRQIGWSERMRAFGADGTHTGWASQTFARTYLAPLILEHEAARAARRPERSADAGS